MVILVLIFLTSLVLNSSVSQNNVCVSVTRIIKCFECLKNQRNEVLTESVYHSKCEAIPCSMCQIIIINNSVALTLTT